MLRTLINNPCRRDFRNVFSSSGRVFGSHSEYGGRASHAWRQYCVDHNRKRFSFNANSQYLNQHSNDHGLDEHKNALNYQEGDQQGWKISGWIALIGGIIAYLWMNSKNHSNAEEKEETSIDRSSSQQVLVTRNNFNEIIAKLANNDPTILTLEINFPLKDEELYKLFIAMQNNSEIGYISWYNDQSTEHKTIKDIENKLRDNNKNFRYYPNDYTHALLSTHAYKSSKPQEAVQLDESVKEHLRNWQVERIYDDTQNSGYYGVIYKNDKTHQIVLAHRGSESIIEGLFSQNSDWKTNLEEILGGRIIVGQQARNFQATYDAIILAKKTGYRLSFTGHSLGAWLAELSAFYSHAYFNYPNVKAVTFDSPGTEPMMKKLQPNIRDKHARIKLEDIEIVTYLADPNPANSCNPHVGKVYRVYPKMKLIERLNSLEDQIPGFVKEAFVDKIKGVLTIEGHRMAGILETFDPETSKPKEYKRMADWPRMEYQGEERKFSEQGKVPLERVTEYFVGDMSPMMNMALGYLIKDTTLMTMIGFLSNVITKVNQEQYWEYFAKINSENESAQNSDLGRKMQFDSRFSLFAKAKYREGDDFNLLDLRQGSVDEYLYKLYDLKDKLKDYKNIPLIVKIQLEDILTSFEIKAVSNDGKTYAIIAKTTDGEIIKERMQRLLLVVPKQARDISQNSIVMKTILNVGNDVVIKDKRLLKLPDNLPLETPYYIEILDKRKDLEEKLKNEQVVVISGPGGMGKSTFATKYGRDYKKNNGQVIWLDGDHIETEFLKLAHNMNIGTDNLSPERIRDLVYGGLERGSQNEQKILLIFDNLGKQEKLDQYLSNLPNHAKVIVTARDGHLLTGKQHVELKGFNDTDALAYLKLAFQDLDKNVQPNEVNKLMKTIGKMPFRLASAVAYFKKHRLTSIDKYIEEYKAVKKGRTREEIFPGAELLLRDLQEAGSRQLLNYLAYLDIGGVSLELIQNIMGQTNSELDRYVQELDQSSLIDVITDKGQILLKVKHAIVKDETKNALSAQNSAEIPKILQKLIDELNKQFPDIEDHPQKLEEVTKLINHAKILIKESKKTNLKSVAKEQLLEKIGFYDSEIVANYKEAILSLEELLAYRRSIRTRNHPDIAEVLDRLGRTYKKRGGAENIRKGLEYQDESLKIRQEILQYVQTTYGSNHPEVAKALSSLGNAYRAKGDIQKRIKIFATIINHTTSNIFWGSSTNCTFTQ